MGTLSLEMDETNQIEEPKQKKGKGKGKSIFVNVQNTKYLTVRHCMKEFGYKFTESTTKNLLFWCDSEGTVEFTQSLQRWQFYNHFPGMLCIAHKVDLVRLYNKMTRKLPDIYNFHPRSFIIPLELSELQKYMISIPKKSERTVIVKPDCGSQGKGILIIQDFDDLDDYDESAVAQYYIPPLLLNGKKFDMRIYVLVTSCDPLRIYILNEGMIRFCTEDYQPPKSSNLDEVFSHLTNFSLNKKNSAFDFNENKKYMTAVFEELKNNGIDIERVQKEIDRIIRLTLIAAQPFLASNYHIAVNANDGKSRCFEILGFDILLDSNAHPWLLEVNCMPSLANYSEFDMNLKTKVIMGTLKILDLKPNFKARCMQRFRDMSTRKKTCFKPFFDPEKESEIAKNTDWRQLIPVVDDPEAESICNQAIIAASNSPMIRREFTKINHPSTKNNRPLSSKSMASSNSTSSSSLNTPRVSRVSNPKSPISKYSSNSNVNMNSNSNSNANMNANINDNSQKKGPHLTRPQTKSAARLSQPRTPRSVILADEARMSRINALDKRNQYSDVPILFSIFTEGGCPIYEKEERERIKNVKKQASLASSVSLLKAVKSVFRDGKVALFCQDKKSAQNLNSRVPSSFSNASQPKRVQMIMQEYQASQATKRPYIKFQSSLIPVTGIQCNKQSSI